MPAAPRPAPSELVGFLERVSGALAHGDDLDQTLADLLSAAADATGADVAAAFLQDPDRVGIEPVARLGIDDATWSELVGTLGRDDDPITATARDRAGTRRSAPDQANGAGRGFLGLTGTRRAAFEPLVVSRGGIQQVLGVIALGWRSSATPGPDEGRVVASIAQLASVAVDHGRLASFVAERSEWFERVAQSDPLTGLANERVFSRVLELELARASRQGSQLSVALFDVDGFVGINRRGGHEAGDAVLKAVAAVLTESVRLVDTVARVGGDEFVVLAPGSAGSTVARRVIEGVATLPPTAGGPISISAGVARFPGDGKSAGELLEAAMAALAEAKGRGPATLNESSGQAAR